MSGEEIAKEKRDPKKDFFDRVDRAFREGKLSHPDVEVITAAYSMAFLGHFSQKRETQEPFIDHPLRAGIIAIEEGFIKVRYIVTVLLHDLDEDAPFRVDFRQSSRWRQIVDEERHHALRCLSRFRWNESETLRQKKTIEEYYAEMQDDELVWVAKCCDRFDNLNTCEGWIPSQMTAYIRETETYILPKAVHHAPTIAVKMVQRIREIRTAIQEGAPPRRNTPSGRLRVPPSMIAALPEREDKR